MTECRAKIDSMYHGSCVDGEGLRSVIFFTGCNFRCPFCHNPETLYSSGKEVSLNEVVSTLLRYKNYIKKGGVTLSGGEPFLQADFCINLIKKLKEFDIKVIAETNGSIVNETLIPLLDGVRLDVKNQNNESIIDLEKRYGLFIETCKKNNVNITFTNVLCPSKNDNENSLFNLKKFITKYFSNYKLDFLPFKKMCVEKYQKLGIEFPYLSVNEASQKDVQKAREILSKI
jgi:pyruvate formate lyase activating enzyme